MKTVLTLSNDLAELGGLREFAAEFAERNGFRGRETGRLLVILDELFSNIVRHGYDQASATGEVEVRLSFTGDCANIVFIDDGRPFNPFAAPVPDLDLPADLRPIGGLGIHFVRSLVDAARYSRRGGRNRLVLTCRIDPSSEPRADCSAGR